MTGFFVVISFHIITSHSLHIINLLPPIPPSSIVYIRYIHPPASRTNTAITFFHHALGEFLEIRLHSHHTSHTRVPKLIYLVLISARFPRLDCSVRFLFMFRGRLFVLKCVLLHGWIWCSSHVFVVAAFCICILSLCKHACPIIIVKGKEYLEFWRVLCEYGKY